ncbi:hypothetical protein ATO6_03315 [Oceanicola sp. 22II-s10i]|uniref:aminotransferase-like domain-containing protein n=1 Tax=Oceanicola sp. 22II-s10i TaxID=1317116 RepID=UPI000B520669|nr:PLP-dependent aminotransferase family protein [Oceanicola sp. 22II-s10i]OWU85927.1 hypothetical protein ATO6_03315 [Oceanicola sp. 22II-s10i]
MSLLTQSLAPGLPPAVPIWKGFPKYNFVGGNIDPDTVATDTLAERAAAGIRRHGARMAFYNMGCGPLGFDLLRERIADRLNRLRGMDVSADGVLVTSGSGQGLDLINTCFVAPGDTVLMEQHTYSAAATRLKKLGARIVSAPLDGDGIDTDALAGVLEGLRADGVRPKFIFTIPTIQNPTGSILPLERRHALVALAREYGVPIIEDECYAELTFDIERPPAIHALAPDVTVYVGSYSKTLSPAMRLGFIAGDPALIRQIAALKADSGTSSVTQAMVAEVLADGYDAHTAGLCETLKAKRDTIVNAVAREFGTSVDVAPHVGGIYIWLTFPEGFDTRRLLEPAAKEGVIFNAGADWSVMPENGERHMRLCFAHMAATDLEEGVATLARVCHDVAGFPERRANVAAG